MKQTFKIVEGATFKELPIEVGDFFLKLLHSVTNAHILHLQSRSYSQHKALQKFYESIGDLTDSLIEAWQGKNSQIANYPNSYFSPMNLPLMELQGLSQFVQTNRSVVGIDSELQNLIDDIQQLIDSTIYKLTFLE